MNGMNEETTLLQLTRVMGKRVLGIAENESVMSARRSEVKRQLR
jgi:hypothetical protein